MKIKILTPSQFVTEAEVDELYAFGPKGEFGVLPGHAHYVTPLEIGPMRYLQNGETHAFVVTGGYLEVAGEEVIVMADEVEKAEKIDRAASESRLKELNGHLSGDTLEPEEFQKLLAERNREQARLMAIN